MASRTAKAQGQGLQNLFKAGAACGALTFCLIGCHENSRSYSYCIVEKVDKRQDPTGVDYLARCNDGTLVVFPRVVHPDEGVYYTPYFVDPDSVTVHGYIKSIEKLL